MNTFIARFVVGSACMAIALLWAPLAVPAAAQELPAPVGEFAAGALLFADDGVVTEGFAGGTVRFYHGNSFTKMLRNCTSAGMPV